MQGPRYANMRKVILVGYGLANVNGVADSEVIAVAGKDKEPYEMATMAIAAIDIIIAIRPPVS